METRTVQECRIYVMVLNTFGSSKSGEIAAVSDDYIRLVDWYKAQFADEPYREDGWYKVFKKGSPIEYNNPIYNIELNDVNHWNHGIHDEWVPLNSIQDIKNRYNFV